MNVKRTDVVIIGSGLAGLMTADYLYDQKDVMLITKSELTSSNSWLAQGGIAAAVAEDDHWQEHYNDTVHAGAFHNCKETTSLLVKHGTRLIKRLIEIGVKFDKDDNNQFSLGMEGAHGKRRILHAGGDATGKVLIETILARVVPNIKVLEGEMAYDLRIEKGICRGVYTKDKKGQITFVQADHVIIATGGIGQMYSSTSNCSEATGDGIAMAYRAGAAICDMEFIQFHPTLLKSGQNNCGLISEAVRGEGAKLVTEEGILLMKGKHPLEDLAPRDIVSREIYKAVVEHKKIYLDISNIKNFKERFPSIYQICQKDSRMYEQGLLLVEPGAHFIMGGIEVNKEGQTTISNLYAVGECANTGVHGANRLASNSLLEAIVFAERLAKFILNIKTEKLEEITSIEMPIFFENDINLPTVKEIHEVMDRFVGIVRHKEGLQVAVNWFGQFQNVISKRNHLHFSSEQKVICNMISVGSLIANSALLREESRGGHFRTDFPVHQDESWFRYQNISCDGVFSKRKLDLKKSVNKPSIQQQNKELSIS